MSFKHLIALGLFALGCGFSETSAQAGTVVYDFEALCDDCAGAGELVPWNFENMDDDIYQTVFGRLTLFDYSFGTVMDASGELGTVTEFEFSYFGSTLVDPFTISSADGGAIYGGFNEDDSIIDLGFFHHIVINWGRGNNLEVNGGTGYWTLNVDGCCGTPEDVGNSAQFSLASVPQPGAVALLGVGLLGLGVRRLAA